MSSPLNTLDLTGKVWSREEFEHHNLKVISGGKIIVFPLPKENVEPPSSSMWNWGVGLAQGTKHLLGKDSDTSLFAVTEEIDKVAHQLLNQEFEGLKKPHSAEESLSLINETFQHLNNLKQNLINHDKVVTNYNSRFFSHLLSCPTHEKMIEEIDEKLANLAALQKQTQIQLNNDRVKEFGKLIRDTAINLNNGLVMTKDVLLRSYPLLLQKAKDLGVDEDADLMNPLHALLNRHYVAYLIDAIKQDQIPLPYSIQIFIRKLGITEGEMKDKFAAGKQKLIAKLESFLDKENVLKPCPQFAEEIQQEFLGIATSLLAPSEDLDSHLKPLLRTIYLFELETRNAMQKAQEITRKECLETLNDVEMDPKEKEIVDSLWRAYKFPSYIEKILDEAMNKIDFDFKTHQDSPDAFQELERAFENMKKQWNFKTFLRRYFEEANVSFLQIVKEAQKLARGPTWFEKNAHAIRFSFNQSSWGDQQIFGEGACMAINYRWIRHLINHPSSIIRSAADLNETLKEEEGIAAWVKTSPLYQKIPGNPSLEEKYGVTSDDRRTQATYQLELRLDRLNQTGSVGNAILKRDRMTYKPLEKDQPTIENLINAIVEKHTDDLTHGFSGGLVDIGIYVHDPKTNRYSDGHAIGMQIEPTRGLYRFWDVNSGFYQYSSLQELREAFKGYMQEFYAGQYNIFDAGMYQPL